MQARNPTKIQHPNEVRRVIRSDEVAEIQQIQQSSGSDNEKNPKAVCNHRQFVLGHGRRFSAPQQIRVVGLRVGWLRRCFDLTAGCPRHGQPFPRMTDVRKGGRQGLEP